MVFCGTFTSETNVMSWQSGRKTLRLTQEDNRDSVPEQDRLQWRMPPKVLGNHSPI